jgi:hypothetical protein
LDHWQAVLSIKKCKKNEKPRCSGIAPTFMSEVW